jgi:hypothetical protein
LTYRGNQIESANKPDLSQVIAEEFGANATYVEGLLERFRSNPSSSTTRGARISAS